MSAAWLGPGVRVWIGWAPDHRAKSVPWARCKTGTVVEYAPLLSALARWYRRGPYWLVAVDGFPNTVFVEEYLLHPLDDGDPEAAGRDVERPRAREEEPA